MITSGFSHTAFTFAYESLVAKSSVSQTDIPPGALITFLQKGLEYVGIEEHINEDGSIREFDGNYSLLSPFICDAIASKEDRRPRRLNGGGSGGANDSHAMDTDEAGGDNGSSASGAHGLPTPSTVVLK